MATKQKIPYYTNLGGLNLRVNDPLLKASEAQVADNCVFQTWGGITQRGGFKAQIISPVTTDKIRVIHQHVERATNIKTRLLVRGTNITKLVSGVETVLDSTLTNSTLLGASAQLFDDSVLCTGADEPRSFNSSTGVNTIDTQGFKAQWCVSFANYMVYGGDPDLPQRIVFSALGDAKTVNSSADFIDILDADQKITGAFVLFNSLWVTSIGTITKIDGSDFTASSPGFDAQVRTIWRGDGSVNHQSITVAHDRAYFLGRFSIYEFDGRTVKEISELIQPFIVNDLNRTVTESAVTVHDQRENLIIISVASGNTSMPDTHFAYHYETALLVWSKWTGFTTTYWYEMEEAGEFPVIWHGDNNGQTLRHGDEVDDIFDTAETNVLAVDFRYKTGWQHLNGPAQRFLLKQIYPIVKGTALDTIDLFVFRNYSAAPHTGFPITLTIPQNGPIWGAVIWGSFIWGGPDDDYMPTVGVQAAVWRNYAIEYRHQTVGETITIVGWTTSVIPKGLTDGNN